MPKASSTRALKLDLDEHTALLSAEALRGEADRRRRAGIKLSGELADAKRGGADIRTGAMQVVAVLAEADALSEAADQLATAWEVGKPKGRGGRRAGPPADPSPPAAADPSGGDDDDELDEEEEPDPPANPDDPAPHEEGGATVLNHADDPDVAAALTALGLGGAPAAVAPAGPTPPPTLPVQS